LLVVIGYASSFYFLSITLRTLPLGVAYAIWSGVGIALLALIGWIIYHQALNMMAIIGISLIIAGVIVLVLFSKTTIH
jgi:small multidrug resistance pump